MRVETVQCLKAPVSGAKLELQALEVSGDDVISGRLIEAGTGAWYRIEEGIADLLPAEYRNAERYEAFRRNHGFEPSPAPGSVGSAHKNTLTQVKFFSEHTEMYESEVVHSRFYEAFDEVTVGRWIARTITPGTRVVEVGCGTGRQTLPLVRAGAKVVAVDLSENMLRLARRKVRAERPEAQADFVAATAENLPLRDEAFDAAVIFGSLHHFTDPRTALLQIASAMKPGAHFYLMEPHKSPARFIFDWMMRRWKLWTEEASDDPLFTSTQFESWLNAGGLEARIRYGTYLPPHLFYRMSRGMAERLLATTDAAFGSLPGFRRLGGVIIAEAVKRP